MIDILDQQWFSKTFFLYFLTYCRVQACVVSLPVFSMQGLPVRVRVSIAMAMTPLLSEGGTMEAPPETLIILAGMCLIEILTGLALGAMVRLFAMALDIAASAIAATASLSQIVGVATEHAPHPIGNLLHLAGYAFLMAIGFPVSVCMLLYDSFVLWPIGSWPRMPNLYPAALDLVRDGFKLALMLAAPMILGGYLFQILSGIISKVMPSLPVMFIATPGAVLLALIALVLLGPSTVAIWAETVVNRMPEILH